MNKQEIIQRLQSNHQAFTEYIQTFDKENFIHSKDASKWSAGQQLDHIRRSIAPLNLAFRLPKWLSKMIFGTSNRPTRTYEALIEKYHSKLAQGGKASGNFIPKEVKAESKDAVISKVIQSIDILSKLLANYSEEDLDKYLLPHPLLGKLTLREMLYFTIYHVTHHHKITMEIYK